ncbi:FecCD family ABC transporter permease [Oerskovia flava]|uniref:FecCD family ABC transporter permease n=1 Tax=Oerskovia flava TaxID=2986422 RepID=UPI00223EE852|nr:iron chelate uptake ABC transporter family permease subunit [Oerskovia sp. JB1-3-2]
MSAPDAGRWLTLPGLALPWNRRATGVAVLALLGVGVATLLALTLGELGVALRALPAVLAGEGSRIEQWTVFDNRLPRALVAIGAGAALGMSGAIFQSVTRNPLGSPDIIGLNAGAAAGAVATSLVWPGVVPVPVGALLGGAVAVGLVLLGSGRGFAAPYRMVVIGIGVGAMAIAFVQYAMTRARREDATEIAAWISGSLAARSWSDVTLVAVALVVLVVLALLCTRGLQQVEMGDDVALALGSRPGRVRAGAVAVGVGLSAAAVVVAGPIAFVALVAPQVGRRLTLSTGPGLVVAAALGALLLSVADLLAVHLPWTSPLPTGIVTAGLGGVYLAALLVREWRRGTT